MKVQAAVFANSFPLSSNFIGSGNFLAKAAGTKACYDNIFEKREGTWYTGDSNLKESILFHVITYLHCFFQKKAEFAAALAINPLKLSHETDSRYS